VSEPQADPEAAYFQTIEERFVERRGHPLTISNVDWTICARWRREGVPLRIVERGIAEAFESRQRSWARERPVQSLRFCERSVDAAAERWRRALGGVALPTGPAGESPSTIALLAMAEKLAAASLGREAAPLAADLADELRQRAHDAPGARLEAWLAARERDLVDAMARDAGPEEAARLEAEVDEDLAGYRARLPAKVLSQVRGESLARRWLETRSLPRLSLFEL
jgi:hypothetical protein